MINASDPALGDFTSVHGVAVAMTPDGRRAFVALRRVSSPDDIHVFDTATNLVVGIGIGATDVADVAVDHDGRWYYVAFSDAPGIGTFSTLTLAPRPGGFAALPHVPFRIAVAPGGDDSRPVTWTSSQSTSAETFGWPTELRQRPQLA